ncbi:MAG: HAD hydrolase family protein [Candidatus Heimdallarchaeota archaeon]|nr:MAG: HAD hydrolase family protein [Candidatus Heimdallarchaeota archaeon]
MKNIKEISLEPFEAIKKVKMAIFDVDGIFTDGCVYVDSKGRELIKFSRIDGKGIELLIEAGIHIGVISSEASDVVKFRMGKLNISEVYLGIKNKLEIYNRIKEKFHLTDKEICYCGDDLQDIPVLRQCGFSCCPKNAQDEVKNICDYISEYEGGRGFVRDICNKILSAI